MWWLTFYLGWVLALICFIQSIKIVQFINTNILSLLVPLVMPTGYWPKVSIIIPARDEEQDIRNCLISIIKSDYPNLEIICVNDRSLDHTGMIMEEVAKIDKRIRVIHVQELPQGWLGKTHAMMLAGQAATGDYLLFTDADVIYGKKVISHAIHYSLLKGLDHLCLFPHFVSEGFWKKAMTTFMGYAFLQAIRADSISDPNSNAYAGVGPFNLVKKNTYDAVGGFERMRLEILDDMMLGRLIKKAGYHSKLLLAHDQLSFEWHRGLGGVIRGIEKNSYAGMSFSLLQASIVSVVMCTILFMLYGVPFLLSDLRISGFVFALLIAHLSYGYYAVKTGNGWAVAWALPFMLLLNLYALWRSVIITHYQGGVRWRDSFYSLKLLKEYNASAKK